MKTITLTGFFLLISLLCFSQGENNNWYFTSYAGISFNSGSPLVVPGGGYICGDCGPSVSDSLGNLLFYSDGHTLYNRLHYNMPSGFLLNSGCNAQTAFAVKDPGQVNRYYLFNVGDGLNNPGFFYSVVDMTLDVGRGDIVPGMKSLPMVNGEDVSIQGIHGTRHQNNHDTWIVVRKANQYACYLINSGGIVNPVLSPTLVGAQVHQPYLKFSQDGTRMVATFGNPNGVLDNEFCTFNKKTGEITPLFTFTPQLPTTHQFQSLYSEFSRNAKYIYLICHTLEPLPTLIAHHMIFQYDATKTDSDEFMQSQVVIDSTSSLYLATEQLGPDGKIYITDEMTGNLSIINNPENPGVSCNFQYEGLNMNGEPVGKGLPQFLQKYYATISHTGICFQDNFLFRADAWPQVNYVHWDFGDPGSGAASFSTLSTPTHVFSSPGNHLITAIVQHNDNRMDTTRLTLLVNGYRPALGPDISFCAGNTATFDAGLCPGCSYQWNNLTTGLPAGTTQTITTGQAGIYESVVTDLSGCIGRDTVILTVIPNPSVMNNPLAKTICTGEPTDITLISDVPTPDFTWTATLTSGTVTGYGPGAGTYLNQILINNTASQGEVTYRIIPFYNGCSGTAVDYKVTINPGIRVTIAIGTPANSVCTGTLVTFTAKPVNGGTNPDFQWKVNGVTAGTNSSSYAYIPVTGDVVTCVLTSSNTVCTSNNPATSNPITMTVTPGPPAGISLSPSANTVCAGTTVTFTATPVNGGTTPAYQWFVNGTSVGTNSPTYSFIPSNGDLVSCTLTSSETCITNNPASSIQYQ